jgi:hypothetical protein
MNRASSRLFGAASLSLLATLSADCYAQKTVERKPSYELRVPSLSTLQGLLQPSTAAVPEAVPGAVPGAVPVTVPPQLHQPTPHFSVMKKYYPMYLCGRTRDAHLVYYEEMGRIDMSKLHEHGVTVDILLQHYEYCTLFGFEMVGAGDERLQMLSVFDAKNISLQNLKGDAARFLLRASKANQETNASKNCGIVIVNAPQWFKGVWGVLSRLNAFNEETLRKTTILAEGDTYEGLLKFIPHEDIPDRYGGGMLVKGGDQGVWDCEEERRLREWVYGTECREGERNLEQVGRGEGLGDCVERRRREEEKRRRREEEKKRGRYDEIKH